MTSEQIISLIESSSVADLADHLARAMDVPSPLIGADGPPDQLGPEEPYIRAIQALAEQASSLLEKIAGAINSLLLEEAIHLERSSGGVGRPLLLFNLMALLETVDLGGVQPGLFALRRFEEPLRQALADQGADLYTQYLLGYAVNQGRPVDEDFWLRLLRRDDPALVTAGIVGLRHSGWEKACIHLAAIRAAYARQPEIGDFAEEIMLLVDTYPEANWPDCARDHLAPEHFGEIWSLLGEHGRERYRPEHSELHGPPGSAIDVLQKAGKLEEAVKRHEPMCGSPALALIGTAAAGNGNRLPAGSGGMGG
jgi:hypothetical protein